MKAIKFAVLLLLSVAGFATGGRDVVTYLPGFGKPLQRQYAGYVSSTRQACKQANCEKQSAVFYWFVTADHEKAKTPIIIWSSGGPGSSSLYGFFLENGPYSVTAQGTLQQRKYAWNHFANYLMLDQPLGVGLSFAKKSQLAASPALGAEQYYFALQHFFDKHPDLRHHPIYLAGESYAGSYMALLAKQILAHNKLHAKRALQLKGLILISVWVDPIVQQSMDSQYAYTHGLITAVQKLQIDKLYARCQSLAQQHNNVGRTVVQACSKIGARIASISGLELHDISGRATADDKPMTTYLNRKAVRLALHAKLSRTYTDWASLPGYSDTHLEISYRPIYQDLLRRGVKLLIFSGLDDASDCNFLGTQLWLRQLKWPGQNAFWLHAAKPWRDVASKKILAYQQISPMLIWVKVRHSGHMVPIGQPKTAILVKQFVAS